MVHGGDFTVLSTGKRLEGWHVGVEGMEEWREWREWSGGRRAKQRGREEFGSVVVDWGAETST